MAHISVCHISTVHSVNDSRIFYKECQTLAKSDLKVNLVINTDHSSIIDGVNVIALPNVKNRIFRMFVLSFIAFFKALRTRSTIYHFHDPELILIGFLFKLIGRKVIYDVHEDLREDILLKRWLGGRFITKVLASAASFAEKMADYFFDGIVAATPKIASHFNPNKTIILRNFVILSSFMNTTRIDKTKNKSDGSKLIYVGLLARIRGIKEIIEVMDQIKENAELWLIGRWENEKFREECEALPGFRKTRYIGYVKHDEVPDYLRKADIGMVTLHPTKTFIESYPIKVFEYMSSGLPVIMSDFLLWKELFDDAAVFVDPLNIDDIASKTDHLLSNKNISEAYAEKGQTLILTKYNWEIESQKLICLYGGLLNDK